MSSTILQLNNLTKFFSAGTSLVSTIVSKLFSKLFSPEQSPTIYVFKNLNFTLNRGECVVISGVNGSGKSTLLRCISSVMSASSGTITKKGKVLSLLTHGFGAYEDLMVSRNIQLVLQLFGQSERQAKALVPEVAAYAEISERLTSQTSQLSEGMRAKISLAALKFCEFDAVLIDESLNHVDSEFRHKFYLLTREWIKAGKSIVLTSHDDALLQQFGTRHMYFENKSLFSKI